jgi:iron(II)-dependent oxidoreductase
VSERGGLILPPEQSHERDPSLWGALLGRDERRRQQAARSINESGTAGRYARQVLDVLPGLQKWQRANAGEALSLLGDPRFSPPYYLSEMLVVPGGEVILGSEDYPDERPVHAVGVAGFSLAQYPVTQAAYAAFIEASRYHRPRGWQRGKPQAGRLNCPVVCVSARDAEAYCAWLSAETGFTYRLPTEAEWVMAARGPHSQRVYPWGNAYDDSRLNAWGARPLKRVCAVGLFAGGRGLYGHDDLAGNVWEWCSSLEWPYPYRGEDGREDPGTDTDRRVMHGGSWRSRPISVRCAARQGELPTDAFVVVGFRIARVSGGG